MMRRPSRFGILVTLAAVVAAGLLGVLMARTAASIQAEEQARQQRDRAMDQADDALAELARVRRSAARDREAAQEQIAGLSGRVDDLLAETRRLRRQVAALREQVRELGGDPVTPSGGGSGQAGSSDSDDGDSGPGRSDDAEGRGPPDDGGPVNGTDTGPLDGPAIPDVPDVEAEDATNLAQAQDRARDGLRPGGGRRGPAGGVRCRPDR